MNKKINGFTLIEIILVMVFIAFLWVCVVKIINKNMENKVKVYMYNIYNELQHASKAVNKKLINNNKNESIKDILLKTNAINYCDAFASNINTYNYIDCVQGTTQIMISKDVKPNIINTYNCTRTYNYNVNSSGVLNEIYIPSTSEYINDISPYSYNYKNLINDNAKIGNKYYSCTKTTEEIPKYEENEATEFNLNQKIISQAFVSSNNVSFYFITTESLVDNGYSEKNIYNYTANVYQDAICDVAPTGSFSKSSYKNLFIYEPYRISGGYGVSYNISSFLGKLNQIRFGSASARNIGIFTTQRNVKTCGEPWSTIKSKIPNLYNSDRCKTFFNLYNSYGNKQCCIYGYTNKGVKKSCKRGWTGKTWGTVCENPYCYERICQSKIPCVQMPSTNNDPNAKDPTNFYNKWSNYFKNYNNNNIFYKSGVNLSNVNEGTFTTKKDTSGTSSLTYPNHFIYVAIDNAFKYGTYGKDVFAFEHFNTKIIPVGILAYDTNSPLKFNVITRDTNTKKIKRLNNEPVNFCDAMKYTGEKFSKYCECKDDSGNIVTQYKDNIKTDCLNGFGCVLRPIYPNITRFK